MKVYVCQDHQGHWPVGVASIVVAETEEDARTLLINRLAKHSIEQTEPFTLLPVDLAYPEAYVLCDGNY